MDGFIELTNEKLQTPEGISDLNRMFKKLFQVIAGDGEKARVYYGYGSPENVVVANVGSIYLRKDGGVGSSVYFKEANNDAANGWGAK